MNGALLLIPFLLIRFALTAFLEPSALHRAARFAPMQGKERVAYFIYQAANAGIFLGLFFLTIRLDASWRAWGGLLSGRPGPVRSFVGKFFFPGCIRLEYQRRLPLFPQPHIHCLFPLLYWHGAVDGLHLFVDTGAGLSGFCPLDDPG